MGDQTSKLQLADRLIATFNRAVIAEIPTRVVSFPKALPGRRRKQSTDQDSWGSHAVALLAVDDSVVLRTKGQEPINLRAGEAMLLSAREFQSLSDGGGGTFVGFETLGTQPCRFFEATGAEPHAGREQLELFCTPFADDLSPCWKACHEIHCLLDAARRYVEGEAGERETLRSVLRLATTECGRALEGFRDGVEGPSQKSNAARVMAAEMFVSCNIDRDIRKSELAEHLGVSVSQLTLAFREIGQLAVRDRLRFRRVEAARNLLADTSLSVSEVAERVGMNYRHFIRAFRQSALLTPLRYRKYARQDPKPSHIMDEFVHTANFDRVEPLCSLNGNTPDSGGGAAKQGAISVLISNATREPALLSRLSEGGGFIDLGIVAPQKRLSFLDAPGSIWKVEQRVGGSERAGGKPVFFKSGQTNSHFVFTEAAMVQPEG